MPNSPDTALPEMIKGFITTPAPELTPLLPPDVHTVDYMKMITAEVAQEPEIVEVKPPAAEDRVAGLIARLTESNLASRIRTILDPDKGLFAHETGLIEQKARDESIRLDQQLGKAITGQQITGTRQAQVIELEEKTAEAVAKSKEKGTFIDWLLGRNALNRDLNQARQEMWAEFHEAEKAEKQVRRFSSKNKELEKLHDDYYEWKENWTRVKKQAEEIKKSGATAIPVDVFASTLLLEEQRPPLSRDEIRKVGELHHLKEKAQKAKRAYDGDERETEVINGQILARVHVKPEDFDFGLRQKREELIRQGYSVDSEGYMLSPQGQRITLDSQPDLMDKTRASVRKERRLGARGRYQVEEMKLKRWERRMKEKGKYAQTKEMYATRQADYAQLEAATSEEKESFEQEVLRQTQELSQTQTVVESYLHELVEPHDDFVEEKQEIEAGDLVRYQPDIDKYTQEIDALQKAADSESNKVKQTQLLEKLNRRKKAKEALITITTDSQARISELEEKIKLGEDPTLLNLEPENPMLDRAIGLVSQPKEITTANLTFGEESSLRVAASLVGIDKVAALHSELFPILTFSLPQEKARGVAQKLGIELPFEPDKVLTEIKDGKLKTQVIEDLKSDKLTAQSNRLNELSGRDNTENLLEQIDIQELPYLTIYSIQEAIKLLKSTDFNITDSDNFNLNDLISKITQRVGSIQMVSDTMPNAENPEIKSVPNLNKALELLNLASAGMRVAGNKAIPTP